MGKCSNQQGRRRILTVSAKLKGCAAQAVCIPVNKGLERNSLLNK